MTQVSVDRMALATLVDEAAESIPYHDGEYQEELASAVQEAREVLEDE